MAEVFISHSSKDAVIAQNMCSILEQNGISCWMAPRNIMPGDDWATAITKAITTTKVFIIIYSANSAASTEVPKEIMLAGSRHSYIIPYKIDATPLKENFEYHLGASHWISADVANGDYKAAELLAAVNSGLGNGNATINNVVTVNNYVAGATATATPVYTAPAAPASKKQNKLLPVIIVSAAAVLIAAIALIAVLAGDSDDTGNSDNNNESESSVLAEDTIGDDGGESNEPQNEQDEQSVVQDETSLSVIELYAYDSTQATEYKGKKDEFLIFGEKYNTGYVMSAANAWLMFNVKDCTEVTFTVGRIDGSENSERELYVYLDGNEHDYYVITPNAAETITVPLKDATLMKISSEGNINTPMLGIYDIQFKGVMAESPDSATELIEQESTGNEIEVWAFDSTQATEYKGKKDEFLIFGEKYNTGYVMSAANAWLMFNVKNCTEVTFTVGRIDGSEDSERELYVYLDGNEHDYYVITPNAAETITVPLKDAKMMKISSEGNINTPMLGIYDIRFTGAEVDGSDPATESIDTDNEIEVWAYDSTQVTEYKGKKDGFVIFGEKHNTGYVMSDANAWLMFNVEDCTEVTFTVGRIDGSENSERELYIYLDDNEHDYYVITPNAVETITVPLKDAKVLKISSEGSIYDPRLGIYDVHFMK